MRWNEIGEGVEERLFFQGLNAIFWDIKKKNIVVGFLWDGKGSIRSPVFQAVSKTVMRYLLEEVATKHFDQYRIELFGVWRFANIPGFGFHGFVLPPKKEVC